MGTFFQMIKDIQKKERIGGLLSEIDFSFYDDVSDYLQQLLDVVDENPLSLEAYQVHDVQRMVIDICQLREAKIQQFALSKVHSQHHLFKGHKEDSMLYELPQNILPDEEELYLDLIDAQIRYREELMDKISSKPGEHKRPVRKPRREKSEDESEDRLEVDDRSVVDDVSASREISVSDEVTVRDDVSSVRLDERQIAMMYGQVPGNTSEVKDSEPGTDITTPFKPPEVPEDDTVVLQNKEKSTHGETVRDDIGEQIQRQDESGVVESSETGEDDVINPDENDQLLVEFVSDINSDILDGDMRSYGPFNAGDVVLLPYDIVRILKFHSVVNII